MFTVAFHLFDIPIKSFSSFWERRVGKSVNPSVKMKTEHVSKASPRQHFHSSLNRKAQRRQTHFNPLAEKVARNIVTRPRRSQLHLEDRDAN